MGSTSDIQHTFKFVNENLFSNYLLTTHYPNPDLIIRTSGEFRISNFFYGMLHTQNFLLSINTGLICKKKIY